MADGKTHTKVSRRLAVAGAVVTFIALNDVLAAMAVFFGCRAGVILTPDLDINHKIHANFLVNGKWRRRLFYWYWKPYALLIPHRSWLSHTPGVGTTIRVVYAFWWVIALYVSYLSGLWLTGVKQFRMEFVAYHAPLLQLVELWFLGLVLSDIGHSLYDSKFMRFILRFRK